MSEETSQAEYIKKLVGHGPQAMAKAYQDILKKINAGEIISPAEVKSFELLGKKLAVPEPAETAAKGSEAVNIVNSLEEVAQHFGKNTPKGWVPKSTRTVRRWIDGGMPKLSNGQFDLGQITLWLAKKQGKSGAVFEPPEGDGGDGSGKAFWDQEDKKWQAKARELEYRKRLGELVELSEVEQLFVARIVAVTQGLESLARALPPLLVNRSEREMEPIIARRTRALRELFARPLPEKFGASKEEIENETRNDD